MVQRFSLALLWTPTCLPAPGEVFRFAFISNALSTRSRNSVGMVAGGLMETRSPAVNYPVVSCMSLGENIGNKLQMGGIYDERVWG